MTTPEKRVNRKPIIIELAEFLKNVSQTYRINGVSRQHFHDIKNLKKDGVARSGKIYMLTPDEKSRYLKDADTLYPEVKVKPGPIGNKFMDILQPNREK